MIKNLILLTGEDNFRLTERKNFYKKMFRQKYSDGEVELFEREHSIKDLENSIFTQNLFGGRRLVFCENFWDPDKFETSQKTKLWDKLESFSDNVTVFLVEEKLDKRKKLTKFLTANSKVEEFAPLDEGSLYRWANAYATKKGGNLTHKNAQTLVNRCGDNLWNLSREIEKLVVASDDGEISEKMILNFTVPHPKTIIWTFLEDLSSKKVHSALKNFRELVGMGESIHQIFAMMMREIRIHAMIRSGIDQNFDQSKIAKSASLHPFVVKKTMGATKNFTLNDIEKMYDELWEIDKKLKTGGISTTADSATEFEVAIDKFIVNVYKK